MPLVVFKYVFLPVIILTIVCRLNFSSNSTFLLRENGNSELKRKGNEIFESRSRKKMLKPSSGFVVKEFYDGKILPQKSSLHFIQNKGYKLKRLYSITKNGLKNFGKKEDDVYDKRSLSKLNKVSPVAAKKEFYGLPPDEEERVRFKREINRTETIDVCLEKGSCEGQLKELFKYCHCDDNCVIYGDCCHNANVSFEEERRAMTECMGEPHRSGLNTIAGCLPQFENQTVIEGCRKQQSLVQNIITGSIPVRGEDGFAYKNENCAICNNITQFEFYLLSFIQCFSEEESLTLDEAAKTTERPNCLFSFASPDGTDIRDCMPNLYVANGSEDHHPLCAAFINPVIRSPWPRSYYRNVYCGPKDFRKRDHFFCKPFDYANIWGPGGKHSAFPLTAMISLKKESSKTCSSDDGSVSNNGICVDSTIYRNVVYNIIMKLLTTADIDESFLKRTYFFFEVLTTFHPYNLKISRVDFYTFENVPSECIGRNNDTDLKLIKFDYSVYVTDGLTKHDLRLVKRELDELKWQYSEYNHQTKQVRIVSTVDYCNTTMEIKGKLDQRYLIKLDSLNMTVQNLKPRDFCKNNQVNTTLLPLQTDNKTNLNNYALRLDSWVCLDNIKTSTTTNGAIDFNFVLVIATYSGLGLSNVCLIAALTVNRCLLSSFTTPGGNVENVMISILVSQIMFMVGIGANDNKHVCFVMGVIIHYLIVGVYICMTLSVLHIAKTFVTLLKNPASEMQYKPSLRVKMSLLSCTIPAVIVAPCVVMDLYFKAILNVGYTSGRTCFPSAFPANVIVVSGPILACLLINLSCVFAIMISIFRLSGNFRPWYDRLHIPVLIKLFFFTGLPWVFGILSEFLNNDILRVAFVVTYCLQGFFVAITWTFNRRVLRSLRNKKEKTTSVTSSHASTNPVTTEKQTE